MWAGRHVSPFPRQGAGGDGGGTSAAAIDRWERCVGTGDEAKAKVQSTGAMVHQPWRYCLGYSKTISDSRHIDKN